MALERYTETIDVTILSGGAESNPIGFAQYSGGILLVPSAWSAADIGFVVNTVPGGTFVPLTDDGTQVEITGVVVDTAYVLPPEVFAATHIKLWSQSGGTGVNQAADRVLKLIMKS
jgi:hypothetical protein